MSRFHDDSTAASDPVYLRFSKRMMRRHWPQGLFFTRGILNRRFEALVAEHIQLGDSRAALVVGTEPLLVAAFTDELDAVVILRCPEIIERALPLSIGDRLLTVNSYVRGTEIVPDITPGPLAYNRYVNFFPIIAEFVSPDRDRIENRKAAISEDEWLRCQQMAAQYLADFPGQERDSSPFLSKSPAPLSLMRPPADQLPPPPPTSRPPPPPPSPPTPPPPHSG